MEPGVDPMGKLSVHIEYRIPAHLLKWVLVCWKEEGGHFLIRDRSHMIY